MLSFHISFISRKKKETLQLPLRKVSACFNKTDGMSSNVAVLSVMSKKLKKNPILWVRLGDAVER